MIILDIGEEAHYLFIQCNYKNHEFGQIVGMSNIDNLNFQSVYDANQD